MHGLNNILGVDEKHCCGCGACSQSCPQKCISKFENSRGFVLPAVDEKLCVNCGLCRKVCPELSGALTNNISICYIAKAKDAGVQNMSTSGGIFSILAEHILKNGGTVYGCAWNEKLLTHHIRIDNIDSIQKLRQSKYVQSDTEQTFIQVKQDLSEGRTVLYSGTGCQLAGIKNVIGDANNLILVEVACHGVPSPGLFREYIRTIEYKTGKNITGYKFRNRKKHIKGEHYQLNISYSDGTDEYRYSALDPYYASFISGKTLRETCYDCKYKGDDRVGDILLCDFWGCEKEHPQFKSEFGASAVVLTSNKGIVLFESVKSCLVYEKSSWNKVKAHNSSLTDSAHCEEKYKDIMNINDLKPKINLKTLVKIYMPESIKRLIKRL